MTNFTPQQTLSKVGGNSTSTNCSSFKTLRSVSPLWRCLCAGFRHSAGFHARVVLLESDVFRPGLLGEVDDALGVLRVDRVVPIVVRVLVSWYKEE